MTQYIDLNKRIINEGVWLENERTGKRCKTVINHVMHHDVSKPEIPLDTTRQSYWKPAVAELIGYLRGYDNAADFRAIGSKTWDANANKTEAWLKNPVRKGPDDMGRVYGIHGRGWRKPDGGTVDQLAKLVNNLSKGIDDRGEILSFYNVGEFHLGCLRPCMHTHQFSLLGDQLFLTSMQRSTDVPLGLNFNEIQVVTLLRLIAQITGNKPASAMHVLVNNHIYEDQYDLMLEQVEREPFPEPTLEINPDIKSLRDLETWVTLDDFKVTGYQHHPAIKYPFSA